MPPPTSETATTSQPASCSAVAAPAPTLPNPWIATVTSLGCSPRCFKAMNSMNMTPSEVAPLRPWEPPIASGLPVTISGTE